MLQVAVYLVLAALCRLPTEDPERSESMKYGAVITTLVVVLLAAVIIYGIWWFITNWDQITGTVVVSIPSL